MPNSTQNTCNLLMRVFGFTATSVLGIIKKRLFWYTVFGILIIHKPVLDVIYLNQHVNLLLGIPQPWVEFDTLHTSSAVLVEFLAGRHNGWRTRESQALGRGLWEDMVRLWPCGDFQLEVCVIWCNIMECMFSPTGRCWRRTNLAHSKPQWKRSCSSPKGKGVCGCVCVLTQH